MGQFGKVILAETVGLSAKDLRLSKSDDDKSKSTLVAVKKLKSDAPNTTKEAFEKEVNFMSRLTNRNVIHILGVCYEDTPLIMMEYMEKGDLNQYLQKFKTLSTTDSEPQCQITTSTLVHMTTQIASAMKYLASHNFVCMTLTTTTFMGMLFFQFVGCQLNAFMVNSYRSLMYGHLWLPCMKS